MGAFFRQLFATILAIVIVMVGCIFLLAAIGSSKKVVIPEHATLLLKMPVSLGEYPPTRGKPFGERPLTLHDLRMNLKKAAVDKRIDRVVLHMGFGDAGWASIEELRQEIAATRKAGKPVYAYCEWLTFKNEYLAAACDSIWLPPDAYIAITGINAEREFHKNLLDKIGVKMRVHKIEAYKAAGETDIRTDMSPAARENAQWILDETVKYVVPKILADRKKDQAWWDGILARPVMRANEAVELGVGRPRPLLERPAHRVGRRRRGEQQQDRQAARSTPTSCPPRSACAARPRSRSSTRRARSPARSRARTSCSAARPWATRTWSATCARWPADKSIDAVVFRVDSPGGETFASDVIRRAGRAPGREEEGRRLDGRRRGLGRLHDRVLRARPSSRTRRRARARSARSSRCPRPRA
jgi:protease-4